MVGILLLALGEWSPGAWLLHHSDSHVSAVSRRPVVRSARSNSPHKLADTLLVTINVVGHGTPRFKVPSGQTRMCCTLHLPPMPARRWLEKLGRSLLAGVEPTRTHTPEGIYASPCRFTPWYRTGSHCLYPAIDLQLLLTGSFQSELQD